jgi:two-component system sensor histidine kinase AlgZ
LTSAPEADDKYSQAYLPDFCAAGTILVILLVAELVAIVLTLSSYESSNFLTELSKMSMYLLWLALLGTAVMCRLRPWAEKQGNTQAFVVCFVVLEVMCLLLAEFTYQLTVTFGEAVIIDDTHAGFILRTSRSVQSSSHWPCVICTYRANGAVASCWKPRRGSVHCTPSFDRTFFSTA